MFIYIFLQNYYIHFKMPNISTFFCTTLIIVHTATVN